MTLRLTSPHAASVVMRVIDTFHQGSQSTFDSTMKLDALPGSQPKGVVLSSQIIIHSVLIRRENTAGDAPSDHEHELFPCLSPDPGRPAGRCRGI